MADFPRLSSGQSVQYPLGRTIEYRTRTLAFLDGSEQRFPTRKSRRSWSIDLRLLSEGEAADVSAFVAEHAVTLETFAFEDPCSGVTYPTCVVERLESSVVVHGRERCITKVWIGEARS